MIFKTIDDNDSLSGQRIVSKFTARKIAQEEATKQLEIDIQCLRNYEIECQKGSVSTETFSNTMKGASVEAQKYAVNIKNGTGSAQTFATNQKAIQASMSETSIVSKVAATGLSIFKAALNSLIFFAVIEGIQLLIKGIDNLILTADEAEEKAEALRGNMQSFFNEVQSGQQTISSVSDRFSELSEHVTKTGENIDLTKDEYSEYLDICNQVKTIMPELVTGYTNEGNAIITLKDNVDDLTESYKENIRAKAAAFITNGDNDGNTIQSFFDDYKIFTEGENGLFAPSAGGLWNNKSTDYEDYYGYDKVHEWLEDVADLSLKDLQNLQKGTTQATYLYALLKENGYELANITEDNYEAVHDVLDTRLTSFEGEMATRVSNVKMSLQQMLYADRDYWDIDDKEALSAIDSMFSSIDSEFIKQNNLLGQDALQSFESNVIKLFENKDTQKSMIDIYTPQGDDESIEDYSKRVNDAIEKVQNYAKDKKIDVPLDFTDATDNVEDIQKSYEDTINRFKSDASDSSSKKLDSLNKQLDEQTQNLTDAKENLQNEYDKISDWGLDDYADQIKNNTIQTKFGNVDMDKRTIIHWSDELKQTYADALASWDYDPEVGSIDTVFGGSERFGEELNGNGWEVAFTPILPDGTFLSKDTVEEYINSILEEAYADDGKVSEDELTAIDAQGRQVGNTFVQGIFAGIDDSQNYDDNGNWAETVGRLMHFVGNFGAKQLADQGIDDANAKLEETKKKIEEVSKGFDDSQKIKDFFDTEGINTDEEIDEFNKVTEGINRADEAIQKWNEHKREGNETPISFKDAWSGLEKGKDELVKLAKAGRLTANDLKGLEGGKTLMEKTGLSAEQLAEKINKLTDASTQLSSLSGQVSKMSELLSKKKAGTVVEASDLSSFDAEVRRLDSWKEFEKVMGSSKSSMKECKKAADALATEWINDGNYLDKLTDSTKDYYVTQLKAMGVENAEEVVSANLAMKKQEEVAATEYATLAQQYNSQVKDEASQVSETLENATASEIIQLMNEGTISEETRVALANYAFEKDYASSITLMTAADCENLANLCDSLNIAASALRNYAYAKRVYESTENWEDGKLKDAVRSGAKKTMDKLKDAAEKTRNKVKDKLNNQAKVKVKPSSGSSSKSGSGKSGSGSGKKDSSDSKKKFDEEFDWVEVRVNRLERAIDNYNDIIDNTYNNWSKRNKALEKEISRITSLITTQQKAQDIYKKKADKVTVKNTADDKKSTKKQEESFNKYKKLVRDGKIKISDIKDEDVANAIKKYQDYYEKYLDSQDKEKDAQKQLLDAYAKKFDMISEKYDSIIGIYDTKKSNWETEYKGNIEAQGRDMTLAETKQYTSKRNSYEEKTQAQLEKERAELRKKQAEAVKKGIRKDSQEYKDMEKAILEVDQALQESKNTVANTAQEIKEAAINEFNEVSEKYDSIISTFDANKSTYDSAIRSSIESTGRQMNYGDASRYYGSLNNIEASTQVQLTAEIIELQKKLTQAVENGVDQTSNDFRTMQVALIDAQNALQDSQNAVSENTLAIYKTKWSDIDKQIDELDNVLSDSEFGRNLINELGDLYTKQIGSKPTAITGVMTDYGKATLSTYFNDINTYQSKLTKAQEGYANVLSKLVSDPNNDTFKEQANTYKQEIEDATLAIYSSKDDIISFYSDMYNEMLDSLKTISDNTIKQLQTEKDLYDYQKSMKEKTDSLSLLERQLNVYKNDSSESGKMNYQQIKVQLNEAKSDLSDVQYSQFLTDTQSLLDQMNEDASDWVEQTLADKTAIIETALGVVSSSVDAVKGVLDTVNTNITSIQTAVNTVNTNITSIQTAVNNLNSFTSTSTSSSFTSTSTSSGISNISVMPNGMSTVPQITVTPKAPLNDKKSSGASIFESVAIKKVSDRLASHPSSIFQGTKNNSYVGVVNEGLKLLGYKTNSGNGYGDTTAAAVKKFCQDNKVNIDSKTKKTKASGKTMGNDFFKKLISVLKAKGYSRGGVITRDDMDLSALGLRTNNGDNKLVTVKEGERILTPVQNQNFEALTKYLQTNPIIPNISENLVSKIPDVQSTSVPSAYNDYRNVESINFTLPNVTNYDEFITKMQHDKKAISFIQDATIGVAMGKNSLKNRF